MITYRRMPVPIGPLAAALRAHMWRTPPAKAVRVPKLK
jgi:hypothetical protein